MDRAPSTVTNSTAKACVDCAHIGIADWPVCLRSPRVDLVTAKATYFACTSERIHGCGPEAVHFVPHERAKAAQAVRREQLALDIEKSITNLRADLDEAHDNIVAPLHDALKARYGDALPASIDSSLEELATYLQRHAGL